LVLGIAVVSPGGAVPIAIWILVAVLALQHMFPWDNLLGPDRAGVADLLEGVAYAAVLVAVVVAAIHVGIGPNGVPLVAVAVLATVLFARALFEIGVLYGGADAKALMIAGLLVPLFPSPWLPQTASVALLLSVLPFSVNVLVDAALLAVAIPIGIGLRNALRGEFEFPRGFSGYMIPVRELPDRFAWLKDPLSADAEEDAETSEEDREIRRRAAKELESQGVERVWVTPQIPFVVLLALGAVAALVSGNLILDILSRV
jgi:archaeal preflagellin peptidase FlaK